MQADIQDVEILYQPCVFITDLESSRQSQQRRPWHLSLQCNQREKEVIQMRLQLFRHKAE